MSRRGSSEVGVGNGSEEDHQGLTTAASHKDLLRQQRIIEENVANALARHSAQKYYEEQGLEEEDSKKKLKQAKMVEESKRKENTKASAAKRSRQIFKTAQSLGQSSPARTTPLRETRSSRTNSNAAATPQPQTQTQQDRRGTSAFEHPSFTSSPEKTAEEALAKLNLNVEEKRHLELFSRKRRHDEVVAERSTSALSVRTMLPSISSRTSMEDIRMKTKYRGEALNQHLLQQRRSKSSMSNTSAGYSFEQGGRNVSPTSTREHDASQLSIHSDQPDLIRDGSRLGTSSSSKRKRQQSQLSGGGAGGASGSSLNGSALIRGTTSSDGIVHHPSSKILFSSPQRRTRAEIDRVKFQAGCGVMTQLDQAGESFEQNCIYSERHKAAARRKYLHEQELAQEKLSNFYDREESRENALENLANRENEGRIQKWLEILAVYAPAAKFLQKLKENRASRVLSSLFQVRFIAHVQRRRAKYARQQALKERQDQMTERPTKTQLRRIPCMRSLTDSSLHQIIDSLEKECFIAGEWIAKEGQMGTCAYILHKGCIELTKASGKRSGGGAVDGGVSGPTASGSAGLLGSAPTTATNARAAHRRLSVMPSIVGSALAVPGSSSTTTSGAGGRRKSNQPNQLVSKNSFSGGRPPQQGSSLSSPNAAFPEGTTNASFSSPSKGGGNSNLNVNNYSAHGDKSLGFIHEEGSAIGENFLLTEEPHVCGIQAKEDTDVWLLPRKVFQDLVDSLPASQAEPIHRMMDERREKNMVSNRTLSEAFVRRSSKVFTLWSEAGVRRILEVARPSIYRKGDVIVPKGQYGKTIIFIVSGRVEVSTDGKRVDVIREGHALGEVAAGREGRGSSKDKSTSLKAITICDCWLLPRGDFTELLCHESPLASIPAMTTMVDYETDKEKILLSSSKH